MQKTPSYHYIQTPAQANHLFRSIPQVSDQVVPVLLLLEATEGHLGTRNVLLGVLEVGEQSVLLPLDALLLVGIGVCVTLNGTGVTAEKPVQSRADLVTAASLNGVALSASGLEQTSTLLRVACGE